MAPPGEEAQSMTAAFAAIAAGAALKAFAIFSAGVVGFAVCAACVADALPSAALSLEGRSHAQHTMAIAAPIAARYDMGTSLVRVGARDSRVPKGGRLASSGRGRRQERPRTGRATLGSGRGTRYAFEAGRDRARIACGSWRSSLGERLHARNDP
ncbi:MAG TPA: hypothetical protein VNL96_05405 [Gemmatimonadaceae bacterium]|nr:hypothetical protein [Gemmatimonadaceae bacterium]